VKFVGEKMTGLLYKQECYALIGACFEVYNTLGNGFLEAVYQEALQMEFSARDIPFQAQAELKIDYKGQTLNKVYIADFVAYEAVIVEIKAMERLGSRQESQLLNYLNATGLRLGLLVNFGAERGLEWKRKVL
jgi:GxxExxY protein